MTRDPIIRTITRPTDPDDPVRKLFGQAAPRPWSMQWSGTFTANGVGHVYIVDANGRKIAAIWCRADEKEATAVLIIAAVNAIDEERK
jgi:hypothetical protein